MASPPFLHMGASHPRSRPPQGVKRYPAASIPLQPLSFQSAEFRVWPGQLGAGWGVLWPLWYCELWGPLQVSMNMDLSFPEPGFVSQISQSPKIAQNWFCIQNLHMNLSFQEKKTICKSVHWLGSSIYKKCKINQFSSLGALIQNNYTVESYIDIIRMF